ncbi:MAG: hypothetical protein HZC40_07120 [Chloroflexi bacterium]|nr:hypothetical protein [Chloroflexota bacterium]
MGQPIKPIARHGIGKMPQRRENQPARDDLKFVERPRESTILVVPPRRVRIIVRIERDDAPNLGL